MRKTPLRSLLRGGDSEKLKKLEQEDMEDKNNELFHAEHATL